MGPGQPRPGFGSCWPATPVRLSFFVVAPAAGHASTCGTPEQTPFSVGPGSRVGCMSGSAISRPTAVTWCISPAMNPSGVSRPQLRPLAKRRRCGPGLPSAPPWVKALGLWSAGPEGGGIWTSHHTLVLDHPASLVANQTRIQPAGFTVRGREGTEQIHVLVTSLERTSWQVTQRPERWFGSGKAGALVLRKGKLHLRFARSPHGRWEATYRWLGTEACPGLEQASWADFDQQGRLLIAKEGRLFVVRGAALRELMDLNQDQPKRHAT